MTLVGASPNECPLVAHFSGFWGWLLGDQAQSQNHYNSKNKDKHHFSSYILESQSI